MTLFNKKWIYNSHHQEKSKKSLEGVLTADIMVPGNTASRTFLGLLTQSIDICQATSHVQGTTEDRTVSKAQFPPCLQEVHLHEGQEDKQRYK